MHKTRSFAPALPNVLMHYRVGPGHHIITSTCKAVMQTTEVEPRTLTALENMNDKAATCMYHSHQYARHAQSLPLTLCITHDGRETDPHEVL